MKKNNILILCGVLAAVSLVTGLLAGTFSFGGLIQIAVSAGILAAAALGNQYLGMACAGVALVRCVVSTIIYFVRYAKYLSVGAVLGYLVSTGILLAMYLLWLMAFANRQQKKTHLLIIAAVGAVLALFSNGTNMLSYLVRLIKYQDGFYFGIMVRNLLAMLNSVCLYVMLALAAWYRPAESEVQPAANVQYEMDMPAQPLSAEAAEVMATLERFAALYRKGMITNEQYEAKRAELMAKL